CRCESCRLRGPWRCPRDGRPLTLLAARRWNVHAARCSAAPSAQPGPAMIIVHHLNNSRSQRVLWLLEELGLPYEIVRYQRDPKTMLAPKELRAIHPLGKSPILQDGDVTLAESGAIVEYLLERY